MWGILHCCAGGEKSDVTLPLKNDLIYKINAYFILCSSAAHSLTSNRDSRPRKL